MDYYHIFAHIEGGRKFVETVIAESFRDAVAMAHETISPTATLEITKASSSGNVTKMLVGGSLQKTQPTPRSQIPDNFTARYGRYFEMSGRTWGFSTKTVSFQMRRSPAHQQVLFLRRLSERVNVFTAQNLMTTRWVHNIPFDMRDFENGFPVNFNPFVKFTLTFPLPKTYFGWASMSGQWNLCDEGRNINLEKETDFMVLNLTQ